MAKSSKSLIQYPQRVIVVHIDVVECEVVQIEISCRWYFQFLEWEIESFIHFSRRVIASLCTYSQSFRIVYRCWGMITKNFQGNTLFSHGNNRLLIHMRIVNAHAAEDGESLHKVFIIFGEILQLIAIEGLSSIGLTFPIDKRQLTKPSNLLINWMTPMICPKEFLIAIQRMDLCLKNVPSSTLASKRSSL